MFVCVQLHINYVSLFVLKVGQVNTFLEKMIKMAGFIWNPNKHEYTAEGRDFVNFPEFLALICEYFASLKVNTELTCELIGDLVDHMVNGVIMKGWLTKQGHFRKNWKRRFFVLKANSLHYYRTRDLLEKKGQLVLNRNSKLLNVPDSEDPGHPNKLVAMVT